jgi:hypothetical protein
MFSAAKNWTIGSGEKALNSFALRLHEGRWAVILTIHLSTPIQEVFYALLYWLPILSVRADSMRPAFQA